MSFNIENCASVYKSHGEIPDKDDVEKLNEWLSSNGVKLSFDSDPDGWTLKVFKENQD